MISVLVLTLNEEDNLPRCLSALRFSDDVVVLDSFSADKTCEIAAKHGARVVQRKFDNWSSHQNWALENIAFKNRWVYYSDADEIVTAELANEMLGISTGVKNTHVAYRLRYKNFFMGRWIKHCGIYPIWILRFFQPDKVRWERLVNPTPVVNGSEGRLEHHFEHYSFSKGLHAWFDKHNKYSSQEAVETLKFRSTGKLHPSRLLSLAPARRRQALRELSFLLPGRAALRFFYMFVLRLGFLDGGPGFHYCVLLSIYEYMIVLKAKEIQARNCGMAV